MLKTSKSRLPGWLWLMLAAGVLTQTTANLVRPVTSYKLIQLGWGETEIGIATAAYALLPLFLALPFGRMQSRLRSPRNFVALGIFILALGAAYLALTRHVLHLMLASAVLGVGHLMFTIGGQSMVARRSRADDMDANFGWFTASFSVGQMIGPLLSGLILGNTSLTEAQAGGADLTFSINLALWDWSHHVDCGHPDLVHAASRWRTRSGYSNARLSAGETRDEALGHQYFEITRHRFAYVRGPGPIGHPGYSGGVYAAGRRRCGGLAAGGRGPAGRPGCNFGALAYFHQAVISAVFAQYPCTCGTFGVGCRDCHGACGARVVHGMPRHSICVSDDGRVYSRGRSTYDDDVNFARRPAVLARSGAGAASDGKPSWSGRVAAGCKPGRGPGRTSRRDLVRLCNPC